MIVLVEEVSWVLETVSAVAEEDEHDVVELVPTDGPWPAHQTTQDPPGWMLGRKVELNS